MVLGGRAGHSAAVAATPLVGLLAAVAASGPGLEGAATPVDPRLPEGSVVDMVVARVNDAVVTLSELVAQTGLVLLRARGDDVAIDAALSRDLLASVLDAVINEMLLHQEVRRLQLEEVPERAVLRAYRADLERFADPRRAAAFATTYGFERPEPVAPPPLWTALLNRRLAVDAFLEARARLDVQPSSSRVLRCYEANAAYFAGRSFADAEPIIRSRIEAQEAARTAERLIDDLRRRARIRVAAGFEARQSTEPRDAAAFTCPIPDVR